MAIISDDELQEIVRQAETVPQDYRVKCFELLLAHALGQLSQRGVPPATPTPPTPPVSRELILPIDVKAFLTQYGLEETVIRKYFLIQGQEIRPIYRLSVTKKARAQVQHSLMIALESALSTGAFQVNIEALRARCHDQNHYDSANFMKTIRENANLYKAIDDVDVLTLSPDGKSELAELLEELAQENA